MLNASNEDSTYIDLAGNCSAVKPAAGIIIGGYIIWEVGTDLPDESQMHD